MVAIRLEGLGARYGKKLLLQEVTTPAFTGGEMIAVIGPNAAGKSTLFKRIAGLLRGPGQVRVGGARRGRDAICYMPQDSATNAVLTVYESILLARKQGASWSVGNADLRHVDETMAALDIADIAFRNIGELSGGQRQLVSLAQTLVREPEILLMDEPTSALDLSRQIEVLAHMRRLAKARSMVVLMALHDLNHALRYSDRTMVIADGRLVAWSPAAPRPKSSRLPSCARSIAWRRASNPARAASARSSSTASQPAPDDILLVRGIARPILDRPQRIAPQPVQSAH